MEDGSNYLFLGRERSQVVKLLDKNSKEFIRDIQLPPEAHMFDLFVQGNMLYVINYGNVVMEFDVRTGALVRNVTVMDEEMLECSFFCRLSLSAPAEVPPEDHMVLVSDLFFERICVFNLVTGVLTRHFGPGLKQPMGLAVWTPTNGGPADTMVFVCDQACSRVSVFNLSSGTLLRHVGYEYGSAPGEFNKPEGVTVYLPAGMDDDHAVVVVSDTDNHRVQVFALLSGALLRVIGNGEGDAVGQLQRPSGAVVHRNPTLGCTEVVVCDSGNHRLQVFDLYSGAWLAVVEVGCDGEEQGSSYGEHLSVCVQSSDDEDAYVLK